jgi:putative membrane protein
MGWYHENTWGVGSWIGMGFGMLVFWGLLIVLVIALVRWVGQAGNNRPLDGAAGGTPPPVTPGQSGYALRILDERFARGDISEEEYVSRRDILLGR